ncbi:MAG: hypothetical protein H0X24_20445 [Ktedonobacterales bacterium]|nr:hypothetical protein [Ktedonobacterales bacterium]
MQPLLKRLRALPRWYVITTMGVLLTLVSVVLVVVLAVPTTPDENGKGRGPSGSITGTATVAPPTPGKGTPSATKTPGATNLPVTVDGIHIGLAFDSQVTDLASLSGKVDLVWGASKAQSIPGAFTIGYNPSERIGNGTVGPLYTIDWFQKNHPDWIVYTCDKKTPAYGFGEPNTPIDITNPAVLQFVMQQQIVPQIKAGYQGIGFDNVGFTNAWERCGHFDAQRQWVQIYSGLPQDPRYQQSLLAWGQNIHKLIKDYAPTIKISMNFSFDYGHRAFWQQMLPYIDILTDEGGFSNFGSPGFPYVTGAAWQSYVTFLQQFQRADDTRGLFLFAQFPGTTVSSSQLMWALSNYLLVKGRHAYTTIVGAQQYGQFYDHPEFHLAIGTPQGDFAANGCAYQRLYTKVIVLVNPSGNAACTVTLPHAYKSGSGATVTVLTLASYSGAILATP